MIFKSNAGELHYEDFGQGPAVVVLHDNPSNRELRTALFEALAETGCRVIIANPCGLDFSPRATPLAEDQTAQVLALFNHLGIGRAVLIGIAGGGYATLDLLERHPNRIAAASFVVSTELAVDLRRRAGSLEGLQALQAGHCESLKGAFCNARLTESAPPRLLHLRAWINRLRERRRASQQDNRKNWAALLAGLGLPPLVVEADAASGAAPPIGKSSGRRTFRPLGSLSAPLQALLNALLPDESLFEEENEEISPGHG
jgi:pimeloyl-ACP methyl ester carboxylesterase